jgi:hypothetical protein
MIEGWTNSSEALSNEKIDVVVAPTRLFEDQKKAQQTSQFQPGKRSHIAMKLSRFDQIFSHPLNTTLEQSLQLEVSNARTLPKQRNPRSNRSENVRNQWSCPCNLGTTRNNTSKSFIGRRKKQNRSLLPTIIEFQKTSFKNEMTELLTLETCQASNEQIAHAMSTRGQPSFKDKRSSRSTYPEDQQGRRSCRISPCETISSK